MLGPNISVVVSQGVSSVSQVAASVRENCDQWLASWKNLQK